MKYLILLFLLITSISADCSTYVHYNNDKTQWGGGPCQSKENCSLVGVCILKECICPPERGGMNCEYIRYSASKQGWLMFGLSPIGLGCISNFMINYIGQGVGQLLIFYIGLAILILGLSYVFVSCGKLTGTFYQTLFIIVGIIFMIASFTWQVTQGALILTCNIPDGNGYGFYG